ncbi:MAG: ABC transporter ATP-binding protein [Oscillospiraceae bacterium]|nr:ABC transporter ATP-binding protein [Oscillospiraceae bacterium]
MMLEAKNVTAGYDKVMVINDISISIGEGEIVSIIGRNGVGKSTFMKTLMGLLKTSSGSIIFDGEDITAVKAHNRAKNGLGYVPQGHGIFPGLTVEENMRMGCMINSANEKYNFDMVYTYFPRLAERKKQMAGSMSGGEQAMLSIGRVLVGNPKILLLDEPSEGVQPNVVSQMGDIVLKISKEIGLTVLMVEQHMGLIQQVTERSYVLDKGSIVASLTKEEVNDNNVIKQYLTV